MSGTSSSSQQPRSSFKSLVGSELFKIRSQTVQFRHILEDIQTLNQKARDGEYDLTAISYHAYPYVADKYMLMAAGSSIGDGYGPMRPL